MKIAIIGCGWLGKRLAKHLSSRNHHVLATTTSPGKVAELQKVAHEVHVLDFSKEFHPGFLKDMDMAIFSMPISRESWHKGFQKFNASFKKTLFFSSTGIYPQQNGIYTENYAGNLRDDILASEQLVKTKYPETIILRLGGLMGDERSLKNFYADRQPPEPEKKVNYIHYEDISAMVELLLSADHHNKLYNIVAPEHPTVLEVLNGDQEASKSSSNEDGDRIIPPDLFIKEFNYKFIHPNPKYF
ncbi:NAD(P)-binding domain-containing protein [Kaistella sp.]|uniref:NAD(P)-binding domain-containing protein n=1 Tax=Kaistella sp. TaxID=2782235 RepID=UPI002F95AD2B